MPSQLSFILYILFSVFHISLSSGSVSSKVLKVKNIFVDAKKAKVNGKNTSFSNKHSPAEKLEFRRNEIHQSWIFGWAVVVSDLNVWKKCVTRVLTSCSTTWSVCVPLRCWWGCLTLCDDCLTERVERIYII